MAITQIHTLEESPRIMTRRRGRRARRDGEGGALDASRTSDPEKDAGADVVAPTESSKSDAKTSRSHLHRCVMVRIAGGRQLRQRQRSQLYIDALPAVGKRTAYLDHAYAVLSHRIQPQLHSCGIRYDESLQAWPIPFFT